MSKADNLYVPLYGDLKEDQAVLSKFVEILNRMDEKGATAPIPKSGSAGPGSGARITYLFRDGTELKLYLLADSKLAYDKDGQRTTYSDKASAEWILGQLVLPDTAKIDKQSAKAGEKIHIVGGNANGEKGKVYIFWDTKTTMIVTAHSDKKGIDYPSDTAILLYEGQSRYGQYDFTFPIPAAGEAWDGSTKPISYGQGTLYIDVQPAVTSHRLTIQPAAAASLLAVNGEPVTDVSANPITVNGRTLVPLRAAASLLGQKVEWDGKNKNVLIRTTAAQAAADASGKIGLWIDGQAAETDVDPIVRNGTVYVPIRVLASAFKVQAEWIKETGMVNLKF